jgi:hypothetical protein
MEFRREIIEDLKDELLSVGEDNIETVFTESICALTNGFRTKLYEGMTEKDFIDSIKYYVEAYEELIEDIL